MCILSCWPCFRKWQYSLFMTSYAANRSIMMIGDHHSTHILVLRREKNKESGLRSNGAPESSTPWSLIIAGRFVFAALDTGSLDSVRDIYDHLIFVSFVLIMQLITSKAEDDNKPKYIKYAWTGLKKLIYLFLTLSIGFQQFSNCSHPI